MNELQLALGMKNTRLPAPACPSTPPRSPSFKGSFTSVGPDSSPPQRVVAQIPSAIAEQPVVVEAAAVGLGIAQAADEPLTAGIQRSEVESIRIYVGNEVAALLADVEQQITRMSKAGERNATLREKDAAALREKADAQKVSNADLSEQERRELHRARSAEALQAGLKVTPGSVSLDSTSTTSKSHSNSIPRAGTPIVTEEKQEDLSNFMLSSAVFKPQPRGAVGR